jgi:hypothetical protein
MAYGGGREWEKTAAIGILDNNRRYVDYLGMILAFNTEKY